VFENRLCWYDEIGSTNDVASAAAEAGAPEGLVVVANTQSTGAGRVGRSWSSPSGAGLYVSVVLRPAGPAFNSYDRGRVWRLRKAFTLRRARRLRQMAE
jgi:biotin-(acetyl-CoA carboxylase) ligase